MNTPKQLILLADFSLLVLAAFLGSQLVEAFVLVPYWQKMPAAQFLVWYQEYSSLLDQFYTPITLTAVLLPLLLLLAKWHKQQGKLLYNGLTVLLMLMVLSTYFVYFKTVNASFAQGNLPVEEVALALMTWEQWHCARLGLELGAVWSLWVANRIGQEEYHHKKYWG